MITDKQKSVINMIETNLQIKFEGTTKKDAQNFISEHIERSKQISHQYRQEMLKIRLSEREQEETLDDYYEFGWYNMPH